MLPRLDDGINDIHAIVEETSNTRQLMINYPSITVWGSALGNERIFEILSEIKPTIIYHLATYFIAQHERVHVDKMVDSNLKFGVQIADAAASLGGCHFINVATIWQHLGNAVYNPTSLYASMKQALEDILTFYAASGQLKVTTLVLGDTYGPGDPRPKLLSLFRQCAESGDLLQMTGGEQRLDLSHVDDVVRALILARFVPAPSDSASSRYMVRTGASYSVREIAALYESVFNVRLNIAWGALSYRPRTMMNPPALGSVLPGWQPHYSLADGLRTLESPRV